MEWTALSLATTIDLLVITYVWLSKFFMRKKKKLCLFSNPLIKTYVSGALRNCLNETVL